LGHETDYEVFQTKLNSKHLKIKTIAVNLGLEFVTNPDMNETPKTLSREPRIFLPEDFTVKDWDTLKPYFQELLDGEITNAGKLRSWFKDRSELEAVVSEDLAWRYINMTCDRYL